MAVFALGKRRGAQGRRISKRGGRRQRLTFERPDCVREDGEGNRTTRKSVEKKKMKMRGEQGVRALGA